MSSCDRLPARALLAGVAWGSSWARGVLGFAGGEKQRRTGASCCVAIARNGNGPCVCGMIWFHRCWYHTPVTKTV